MESITCSAESPACSGRSEPAIQFKTQIMNIYSLKKKHNKNIISNSKREPLAMKITRKIRLF